MLLGKALASPAAPVSVYAGRALCLDPPFWARDAAFGGGSWGPQLRPSVRRRALGANAGKDACDEPSRPCLHPQSARPGVALVQGQLAPSLGRPTSQDVSSAFRWQVAQVRDRACD